jgi:hypoxanthine phosphoribosyltransferase
METLDKINAVLKSAECLYSFTELNEALDRMASEITNQLKDTNPLVLCVMSGAMIPTGHILTRLHFPLEVGYLHVTRYQGTNRGGDLHWLVEPRQSLLNRTVLVIDDIMDGGLTLSAIIDYCRQAKCKDVQTAVLVSKKRKREPGVDFEPDYVGVETEDRYLFGFGLDYNEYLRNVPGIYAVKE